MLRKLLFSGLVIALGTVSIALGETIEITGGNSQSIGTEGVEAVISDLYTGEGTLIIQAGTMKYTSASPTQANVVGTTNVNSVVNIANTTIQNGAVLLFDDKITPLSVGTTEYQIEAGGTLRFLNTAGGVNHNADNCVSNYGGVTTISGAGTFEKTGAGALALLNNGTATGSVTMKMDAGGWIDVQAGTFISGGWSGNINWTENKSSFNLASGTTMDMWDGNSPMYVDNLTGSGTFTKGQIVLGVAGNVNSEKFGVANNTAEFSGVINNGADNRTGAVTKKGGGTQILSGNNVYTGTTTVTEGTLQIGNGGTTGTLGTGAVSIAAGATLAFNRADGGTITNAITNNGTIDVINGFYALSGLVDTATGVYHVGSTGGLSIASRSMMNRTTAEDGAVLLLNVDPTGTNGWTVDEIVTLRSTGNVGYGASNSGAVVTADELLVGSQKLITSGTGGFQLTKANSDFTHGITIQQGAFALTGAASLNAACPIVALQGGSFVYDLGAGTETVITNSITGSGTMVVKSGTVKYTSASPTKANVAGATNVNSVVNIANTTIQNGAVLLFDDKITPLSVGTTEYKIEAGGTLRFLNAAGGVGHNADNSVSNYGGTTTISGAGTFEKTGAGALALLNSGVAAGSVTMKMDAGGWIDVQAGTLISGGWSSNIYWSGNKSSLHLASGTTMNMWDGNTPMYVDNLTGSGTFTRGQIVLGVAGNMNSEKFGVANNTAEFSGVINNGADNRTGAVTKKGSGTQILSGNNVYTGTTTVVEGTLQIGNGGTTGTLGTGGISILPGATLAFNRADDVTIANTITGNGTVANIGADRTLSLNMATAPEVSLRTVAGATINYNVTNAPLFGTYSGEGTIHFVGTNVELDASSAFFESTGKTVFDGGTLTAPSYSKFGTLVANDNLTWNLSTGNTVWNVNMYTDAPLSGKILPWSASSAVTDLGTATNMDAYVNNTNTSEYAVISKHQSAVSFTATVFIPEEITLEACGSYDDWAGIFYKKLVNVDDSMVDSSEWETLLPYSETVCGKVTISGDAAPTLAPGYYLFDVRVADNGGSAYANNASLVSARDTSKRLGLGIRLKDSGLPDGQYYDLAFLDDGTVGLPDAKIQLFNPEMKITTNMEIADSKTLTVSNGSAPITSLAIESTVTGPGTFVLENTQSKLVPYSFKGSVEGSMSVGNNIALSVYDSTVGGDFTLGEGDTYQMSKLEGDNNYVGRLNVTGDFNADGATFEVNLTDVPTLAMDPDFAFVTANGASLEGAKFNITYSGPVLDDNVVYNLIETPEGTAPDWSMADFEFNIQTAGDVVMMAAFADGKYQVLVGNSNSLPEPATWLLLACACAGLGVWKWRRK